MEVFRGRKIAIGTVGLCTWHGRTKFGWRVQLEFHDAGARNREFTAAKNVRQLRGQMVQQDLFGGGV